MALILLLAFILVPLLEIAVFIQVGSRIGTWPTVALVVLTAVLGTALIRAQGLSTLARAQQAIEREELPVAEIFDGLCLLIAGALLLTPGFVTDAMGFALLVPPVRTAAARGIWHLVRGRGGVDIHVRAGHRRRGGNSDDETVIEGEFRDVTPGGEEASERGRRHRLPDDSRDREEGDRGGPDRGR